MKRTIIGLAAGALLLAAGCSGEADGQAEPTGGPSAPTDSAATSGSAPESSTSESSGLPHSGAPRVANPLPESVLDKHPCAAALTPKQVNNALGDGAHRERTDQDAGPGCNWSNPERFSGILIGYDTASGEGLSAYYANTKPQRDTFHEASPVAGLPAVAFQPSEGSDTCTTAIGLADKYTVSIAVTIGKGQEDSDPCKGAARVAQDVVGNLKGKT